MAEYTVPIGKQFVDTTVLKILLHGCTQAKLICYFIYK